MDFGNYLYKQLPAYYRYRDIETEYTLERYLKCLGEYLNVVFEETDDIKDLLDVEKMPSKFLPYYAKMFGIKIYDDISEDFQRKLLANIVPILKRKGTRDVIEFVARELTGYDVDITEGNEYAFKTWVDEIELPLGAKQSLTFAETQTIHYRYAGSELTSRFIVYVEIHTLEMEATISEELIRRYLKDLVPSYINVVFVLNQHLIDEEDYNEEVNVTVVESGFRDTEVVTDRTYGNIQYEHYDRLKYLPEIEDVKLHVTELDFGCITEQERYTVYSIVSEGDYTDKVTDLSNSGGVTPTPTPTPIDPEPVPDPDPGIEKLTDLTGAVVMGDSRFVAMQSYGDRYFKDMTVDAKKGCSANYFYNAKTGVDRIMQYPKDAKCFIILLGVNDPETSGQYYMKNMLTALRGEFPTTPVYVIQEYHMGEKFSDGYDYTTMNTMIDGFNTAIDKVCTDLSMHHIDVSKGLLVNNILDSQYSSDGCHLNQAGYDILWGNVKDTILDTENNKDDGKGDTSLEKIGVTTGNVNVRSGASTDYDVIGTLTTGTQVQIVGQDSTTGWYKIKYNNDYGYVSNKYVQITSEGGTELPPIPPDTKDPLYVPDRFTGKVTNNYQLMAKAYEILRHYNTCYLYGGIGQIVTQSVVNAKAKQYPSFYTSARKANYTQYINSSKRYWGFDCVNLYKSILWGWNGDESKSFGGAKYASNGVPDASADGLFSYCTSKSSTGWDNMMIGEALWMSGHFGLYVGNGKCIECSPRWNRIGLGTSWGEEWNGVMLTGVSNCSNCPTDIHTRKWTKHGKLPYIQYLTKNPFIDSSNTEQAGDTTGTLVGETFLANITAYYPDSSTLEGGYQDAIGNPLVGYPDQLTCAVPKNVPLGSKVKVLGTGTKYDNLIFTATDRGGAIVVDSDGTYHVDLCMKTATEANTFGRRKGNGVKVIIGDVVTSTRKVAITKQGCSIRSGAGTSYSVLGKACTNYRFTVLDDSKDWIAVEYHGKVAYVSASVVSIVMV
jgi:phage tail-like protein